MESESGEKQKHNSTEHSCKTCGKSFPCKSKLIRHERIHTGEKSYACNICEKTFSDSSNLAKHKIIHTGEKPYECVHCKKTFIKNSDLTRHKRVHTGEKSYSCDVCQKSFAESSKLSRHKMIHTGEKPYSCDLCQKSFTTSFILSRHNKTAAHIERMKSKNTNNPLTQSSFLDYGESIKEEDIKAEIIGVENDDPLSIHQEIENSNYSEDIKEEIMEEESVDDPLTIYQEIGNSNVCEDIKKEIKEEKNVEVPSFNQLEIDGLRLFSCEICQEKFTERIALMMHKDINHSQHIPLNN